MMTELTTTKLRVSQYLDIVFFLTKKKLISISRGGRRHKCEKHMYKQTDKRSKYGKLRKQTENQTFSVAGQEIVWQPNLMWTCLNEKPSTSLHIQITLDYN